MQKRRRRRSTDADRIRIRGLLFFMGAMFPEFISALSMDGAKINWPLVVCKGVMSGCVALGGFLDQTISKESEKSSKQNSPSNPTDAGSALE